MKLLLDESVPRRLGDDFPPPLKVYTVQEMGWQGIANGKLLRLAAQAEFDLLVTVDQGFQYQQNLENLPMPVVLTNAGRTRLRELKPLVPAIVTLLSEGPSRQIHLVSVDGGSRSAQ